MLFQAANASGATPANVHGFITNTANYSALEEPYIQVNDRDPAVGAGSTGTSTTTS